MTCRHSPGDPDCSSSPEGQARAARERTEYSERQLKKQIADLEAATPDKFKFEILELEQEGPHLVVKVKYPSCTKCSFEGIKIMVFLNTAVKDAVFWKEIDPHFREPPKGTRPKTEAPSPAARFPASKEGWDDARAYARFKGSRTSST